MKWRTTVADPCDFVDAWRKDHPDFDPFGLPIIQRKSHILEFALRGINAGARRILQTIAAFRIPFTYDQLAALLVGKNKLYAGESALDESLANLENRGLLSWDRPANRYDLHPLVRGVIWSLAGRDVKADIYRGMHTHFDSLPAPKTDQVKDVHDLTASIELYNSLINLGLYDKAFSLFLERLSDVTHYVLSACRLRANLLEMLFPDGTDSAPKLTDRADEGYAINALALSYHLGGLPSKAIPLYRNAIKYYDKEETRGSGRVILCNLSDALRLIGALRESEATAKSAYTIGQERKDEYQKNIACLFIGFGLLARGELSELEMLLPYVEKFVESQADPQVRGFAADLLADTLLHSSPMKALAEASRAWSLAKSKGFRRDLVRALRRRGTLTLESGNQNQAEALLNQALVDARAIEFAGGRDTGAHGTGQTKARAYRVTTELHATC